MRARVGDNLTMSDSSLSSLIVPGEKPKNHVYKAMIGDKEITIETGRLARLAGGAVTARLGDTMVLATATMSQICPSGHRLLPA